jgi:hypothetical protein
MLELIPQAQLLAQAKMLFAQAGQEFDTEAFWKLIVRYSGLTELSEVLQSNGQPITAEPADRMPGGGSSGPHEYIRRNVSTGGSPTQGPEQQAMEQMMAAGRDNNNPSGGQ